jgi:uncharacterized repeat protein (TIGR03917 family)
VSIFPPDGPRPWRTPPTGPALVTVHTDRHGNRELTIRPGADTVDVVAALAVLPVGAISTEHFGDVHAILVFRDNPAGPPTPPAGVPAVPATPRTPAGAVAR